MKPKHRKSKKEKKIFLPKVKEVIEGAHILKIDYLLSPNNRLNKVLKLDRDHTLVEIVSVELSIKVGYKWETLLYYDNCHNKKLHRHRRISLDFKGEIPVEKVIKLDETPQKLLEWAIHDIEGNYEAYKKVLLKNSPRTTNKVDIEFY